MRFSVSRILSRAVPLGLVAASAAFTSAAAAPGVTPTHYANSLAPGQSVTITKTVETPPIPPNPDIVLLADTTGSMGPAIANVKANAASIVSQVQGAQPTARFAVAEYQDVTDGPANVYRVRQQLTSSQADIVAGINAWTIGDGGDTPEAWIGALGRIPGTIAFRPDSTRVVVMFGDASSHDPSLGFTKESATSGLQAAGVSVVAIDVDTPSGDGLDAGGQASFVTSQTGGTLAPADPSQISQVILDELENLPATVTHSSVCDDGVSVSLTPASSTVTSGDSTSFDETITLATDAPQGQTVSCTVSFAINGEVPGPEFVQTVDLEVLDVTPPSARCTPSMNPGGHTPTAGTNPRSGQNPDGFYRLTAADNVDESPQVFVRDSGSGHVFGPYASGQRVKYVQAASGPAERAMGAASGILKLVGTGDAEVFATDASGNSSTPVACLVPAPPK